MQIQGKPLLSSLDFFREPKWRRRGDNVHRMRDDGVVVAKVFKKTLSLLFSLLSLLKGSFSSSFRCGGRRPCVATQNAVYGEKKEKVTITFIFSCARTLVRPSRNCFQPKINVFVLSARRFMGIPGSSKLRFDLSVFYICPADMPRNWNVFFAKIWIFFPGKQCVFPLIAKSISFRHVSQKEFWIQTLKNAFHLLKIIKKIKQLPFPSFCWRLLRDFSLGLSFPLVGMCERTVGKKFAKKGRKIPQGGGRIRCRIERCKAAIDGK